VELAGLAYGGALRRSSRLSLYSPAKRRRDGGRDVPSPELIDPFRLARAAYERSVIELIPLLADMAVESVAEVLPGASELSVRGEMNEDCLRLLRIQWVLDSAGQVLYDAEVGHDDESVEQVIDEVNVE
jgi:hypothetical protein